MNVENFTDMRYEIQKDHIQQKPINTSIRYHNETNKDEKNQTWFASLQNVTQKQKLFLDEKIIDEKKVLEQIQKETEQQNKQQQKDNGFEEEQSEEELDYVKDRYYLQSETICYRCMQIGHQMNSCYEKQRCRFCLGDHIKNFCSQNFNSCFLCGQKDHQKATCPYLDSKKCHICNKANHTALHCNYLQLEGNKIQHLREMQYVKCNKCNLQGHFNCMQDFTQQIPDLQQIQREIKKSSNQSHHQNKKFHRDNSHHRNNRERYDNHRSKSKYRNDKNQRNDRSRSKKHHRY